MRDITKLMILKYNLLELKYDFMGYEFKNNSELSFHHLIIPRRRCSIEKIPFCGYVMWNGAILRQNTAHDYLHTVERYNPEMFYAITSEMVDENLKGYLDLENIKAIDDILSQFEKEYCGARTKHGNPLIKEEYTRRILRK